MDAIEKHDRTLLTYARKRFEKYSALKLFMPSGHSHSILSFSIDGVHPHDIATVFNVEAVAIRSGLHCAEPLVKSLGVEATARMSFYLYNTAEDIDRAEAALQKVFTVFSLDPNP